MFLPLLRQIFSNLLTVWTCLVTMKILFWLTLLLFSADTEFECQHTNYVATKSGATHVIPHPIQGCYFVYDSFDKVLNALSAFYYAQTSKKHAFRVNMSLVLGDLSTINFISQYIRKLQFRLPFAALRLMELRMDRLALNPTSLSSIFSMMELLGARFHNDMSCFKKIRGVFDTVDLEQLLELFAKFLSYANDLTTDANPSDYGADSRDEIPWVRFFRQLYHGLQIAYDNALRNNHLMTFLMSEKEESRATLVLHLPRIFLERQLKPQ